MRVTSRNLDLTILRTVGGLIQAVSRLIEDDPTAPDELLELEDALYKFEKAALTGDDKVRKLARKPRTVMFHETDLC